MKLAVQHPALQGMQTSGNGRSPKKRSSLRQGNGHPDKHHSSSSSSLLSGVSGSGGKTFVGGNRVLLSEWMLEKSVSRHIAGNPRPPSLPAELVPVLTPTGGPFPLRLPGTGAFQLTPWLQTIPAASAVRLDALPSFTPPSKDRVLASLAGSTVDVIGSTSSVIPFLSHCYYVWSAWRSVDITSLTSTFRGGPVNFTRAQRKPASILLRPTHLAGGQICTAIDSDNTPGKPSNQLLLDLGKVMERMLTMSPASFASRVLRQQRTQPTQLTSEAEEERKEDEIGRAHV